MNAELAVSAIPADAVAALLGIKAAWDEAIAISVNDVAMTRQTKGFIASSLV
jgi:hypothetical protein